MAITKDSRNAWLDTLRGFASLWVVFFHLNEVIPYQSNIYQMIAKVGWLGVPIFFVMSGYCIQLTAKRESSAINFLWRRFCRIYPPYLASLILVAIVTISVKLIIGANDVAVWPKTLAGGIATLTLMTKPATHVETVNWVFWSLSYELIFYLIIGITLLRRQMLWPILFFITGLSLITKLSDIPGLFFLSHWAIFSLGVALFEFTKGERSLSLILMVANVIGIWMRHPVEVHVVAVLATISIYYSTCYKDLWLWRENLLSKIGIWSYSLYLIHVPIGVFVLLRWRKGIWLSSLPLHIAYDLGVVAGCIAFSYLFFKLIEQPAMEMGKKNIYHPKI